MATWYIDPVSGSDANDGTSWAQAWKTIDGATAAKGVAAGDTVRIAKSPDPTSLGQTALFTNLSRAVVLQTGAVTAHVSECDHVAKPWTGVAGKATVSSTTSYFKRGTDNGKGGSRALQIVIDAGAGTNEKLAYCDLGAGGLDFSGYQQLSLWLRNTAAITANQLKLKLCSDQTGDTPVDEFDIIAIPSTNQFVPLTMDKGSALGSAIKSIALYSGSVDPGTPTLVLDNDIACKAASEPDSITLQSLISKNSAAQGGTEPWYCIQSINGTSLYIDNHTNQLGNGGRGYTGTTETVTIYKRETAKTAMVASGTLQSFQVSGSPGSLIEFQGGYNTSTGLQDGETYLDALNGQGDISYNNKNYLRVNFLNFYRLAYVRWSGFGHDISSMVVGHLSGHFMWASVYKCSLNVKAFNCGGGGGFRRYANTNTQEITGSIVACGNLAGSAGLSIEDRSSNCRFASVITKNNDRAGILFGQCIGKMVIDSFESADNMYGALYPPDLGCLLIKTATITDGSLFYGSMPVGISAVVIADTTYTGVGNIYQETSVRHTGSGLAWKLAPNSNATVVIPLTFPAPGTPEKIQVAVNASAQVTVSAWLRRDNTGLTMSLVCRGGQIAGVDNDVTASMTAAADTWEEVSIQFTPTEAGVVEIEVWAYGGTTYNGYVDDMTVTQSGGPVKADLVTLDRSKDGLPWCSVPAGAEAGGGGLLTHPGMRGGLNG